MRKIIREREIMKECTELELLTQICAKPDIYAKFIIMLSKVREKWLVSI